jgi:hypothetical protein
MSVIDFKSGEKTMHDFILFTMLDNYLNPENGSDTKKMFEVFSRVNNEIFINIKYHNNSKFNEKINIITKLKLDELSKIDILLSSHEKYIIIEIVKEKHSMKCLIINKNKNKDKDKDKEKNLVIINSGLGMRPNTVFCMYKFNSNENAKIINILKINSINNMYDRLDHEFRGTRFFPSREFNDFCSPQKSGSCTYFSNLYTFLYILYEEFNDLPVDMTMNYIKTYKNYIHDITKNEIEKFLSDEKNTYNISSYEAYVFAKGLDFICSKYGMNKGILTKIIKFYEDNYNNIGELKIEKNLFSIRVAGNYQQKVFTELEVSMLYRTNVSFYINFFNMSDMDNYLDYINENYDKNPTEKYNIFYFIIFCYKMIVAKKYVETYAIILKFFNEDRLNFNWDVKYIYKINWLFIIFLKKTKKEIEDLKYHGLIFLLLCKIWETNITGNYEFNVLNKEHELEESNLKFKNMINIYYPSANYYQIATNYFKKYNNVLNITYKNNVIIRDKSDEKNIINIIQGNYIILHSILFNNEYSSYFFFTDLDYNIYQQQQIKLINFDKDYSMFEYEFGKKKFKYSDDYIYAIAKRTFEKNNYKFIKDNIYLILNKEKKDFVNDVKLNNIEYINFEVTQEDIEQYKNTHDIFINLEDSGIKNYEYFKNKNKSDNINLNYTYINPFDNYLEKNEAIFLLKSQYYLLIPREIKEEKEGNKFELENCSHMYNFNDFYNISKEIFSEMLKNIDINKIYGEDKIAVSMQYLYALFYDLHKNIDYNDKISMLENVFYKSELSKEYLHINKNKNSTNILNFIKKANIDKHFGFIDLLSVNYLLEEIFRNHKITNNLYLENVIIINDINGTDDSVNYTYKYNYNNKEYFSNENIINNIQNTILRDKYNKFVNISEPNFYYLFSDKMPHLIIKESNKLYLFDDTNNFIYQDDIFYDGIIHNIHLIYDSIIIFKKEQKNEDKRDNLLKIFYNYNKYNLSKESKEYPYSDKFYISVKDKKNYIFDIFDDNNEIINNHDKTLKNIFNKHNFDFLMTKKKLFIFGANIKENIKNILQLDNLYGWKKDTNNKMFGDFLDILEDQKHENLYFEYSIETEFLNNSYNIKNININNNHDNIISACLILIILAKGHQYKLIMKLLNKFLSLLNPELVFELMNHPYSFIILRLIKRCYNKPEMNINLSFGKEQYLAIKDDNINLFKEYYCYEIIDRDNEASKDNYFEDYLIKVNGEGYRTIINGQRIIKQKECIDNIFETISKDKKSKIYEMMMGFGKSKVIIPNIILKFIYCNYTGKQIIIVVPEHLISSMYNNLLSIFSEFPLCIIKCIRNKNTINLLNEVINGVIILSDIVIKSALLDYKNTNINFWKNRIIYENRIMLIDEVDDCINPLKSGYNMRNSENFISENLKGHNFNYLVKLMREYCYDIKDIDDGTLCEKFKINIQNIFQHLDNFIKNICQSKLCEGKQGEICDISNEKYKKKVLTYILKKIYNVTELINSGKFIYNKNYGFGDDINKNSYFYVVPYKDIDLPDNNSEFNDIYLTLFLTIYIYSKYPLRHKNCEEVQKYLKQISVTNSELEFDFNIKNKDKEEILNDYNTLNNDIFTEKYKNNDIIKKIYITHIIPYKLKYIESYYNTSFLEITNKFISPIRIGFTGTPEYISKIEYIGTEQYPNIGNNFIFEKNIVTNFSSKEDDIINIRRLFFNDENITQIVNINIEKIYEHIKNKPKIRCLIDSGAIFRHKTTREYAMELINLDYDKIFYFEKDDNLYMIEKTTDSIKNPVLHQKELITEEEDGIKFLIFFDSVHTRGTDIKLPVNTHGLVTISEINDSVNTFQAIYRLRQIGKENGQTCEFIYDEKIYKKHIDAKNNLNLYLEKNIEEFKNIQMSDLIQQIIHANFKWRYGDYENIKMINLIYPTKENLKTSDLKSLLNYNYNLNNKIKVMCGINDTIHPLSHYCNYIQKYIESSNIDVSTSTSISISTSLTLVIKIPLFHNYNDREHIDNNLDFINIYRYSKYDTFYYLFLTYSYLDMIKNKQEITKKKENIIKLFLSDNLPINYKAKGKKIFIEEFNTNIHLDNIIDSGQYFLLQIKNLLSKFDAEFFTDVNININFEEIKNDLIIHRKEKQDKTYNDIYTENTIKYIVDILKKIEGKIKPYYQKYIYGENLEKIIEEIIDTYSKSNNIIDNDILSLISNFNIFYGVFKDDEINDKNIFNIFNNDAIINEERIYFTNVIHMLKTNIIEPINEINKNLDKGNVIGSLEYHFDLIISLDSLKKKILDIIDAYIFRFNNLFDYYIKYFNLRNHLNYTKTNKINENIEKIKKFNELFDIFYFAEIYIDIIKDKNINDDLSIHMININNLLNGKLTNDINSLKEINDKLKSSEFNLYENKNQIAFFKKIINDAHSIINFKRVYKHHNNTIFDYLKNYPIDVFINIEDLYYELSAYINLEKPYGIIHFSNFGEFVNYLNETGDFFNIDITQEINEHEKMFRDIETMNWSSNTAAELIDQSHEPKFSKNKKIKISGLFRNIIKHEQKISSQIANYIISMYDDIFEIISKKYPPIKNFTNFIQNEKNRLVDKDGKIFLFPDKQTKTNFKKINEINNILDKIIEQIIIDKKIQTSDNLDEHIDFLERFKSQNGGKYTKYAKYLGKNKKNKN